MVERHYTNGTEPDVLPHFSDTYPAPMECCSGNCDQGRRCPARQAAEAATELGADDPYSAPRPWLWLRDLLVIVLAFWALFQVLEKV